MYQDQVLFILFQKYEEMTTKARKKLSGPNLDTQRETYPNSAASINSFLKEHVLDRSDRIQIAKATKNWKNEYDLDDDSINDDDKAEREKILKKIEKFPKFVQPCDTRFRTKFANIRATIAMKHLIVKAKEDQDHPIHAFVASIDMDFIEEMNFVFKENEETIFSGTF